ncbi:MAG: site-specific DNA-methyltransferase [Nitrospirae bacterium]|nr:site-specific DNA-methyltransferase [Nitrospirota bacterium]
MAEKTIKTSTKASKKPIEQYKHDDKKRLNNPPVGLVDSHTDNGGHKKKIYQYDPHLDPQLQWAGKAEHVSFEVPTVSLHVHGRIDPRRIIETVRKEKELDRQPSLFEIDKKPLREAIEFYKHKENWSNRLISGDSLLVMNSLLEKEGMGGKVQMIYFDPPYGIKYGSNFQPFVNKRDVKDGKDEDLTAEPEMIKAFRDTWELGIHSYLTYLRDRLLLAKELLHESGSVFVQISDENVHRIRCLLDEIFGQYNYIGQIVFRKKQMPLGAKFIENTCDYILWYGRDKSLAKFYQLYTEMDVEGDNHWNMVKLPDGVARKMANEEIQNHKNLPKGARVFRLLPLYPAGFNNTGLYTVDYDGKKIAPPKGKSWKTSEDGMKQLILKKRVTQFDEGDTLQYIAYLDDYPVSPIMELWTNTAPPATKTYVVQTAELPIQRCLLMTTEPGDLVLDITCGSGTTAFVAEKWGRRWITCDTSRVAIALTKQRLMTANLDYYELAHPNEGVGSGFKYRKVPHITLGSIANNEPVPQETLYDQPLIDNKRRRVTGPFTVEAVPAPVVKSLEDVGCDATIEADTSVARSGETLRQSEWKDELRRTGVRGKGGSLIEFTRVETISGTRYLQAEAETKEDKPKRVLVCFGPEHAPLEQRTVEFALEEAEHLKPKAEIVLFCAFQFDEEAAKDIDETNWPGVTLLKAQMNADLLTDDLKKKRSSNESFWLIGQPDVLLMKEIKNGTDNGKYKVEVQGFDYYNPKTGTVESGGKGDIAMWMMDHDYDGRSLFPSQVFFPMAGQKEGWATLAKNLKAEIDEEKIQAFGGTTSLPFTPGRAVAVKIIDARGIESLKIIRL